MATTAGKLTSYFERVDGPLPLQSIRVYPQSHRKKKQRHSQGASSTANVHPHTQYLCLTRLLAHVNVQVIAISLYLTLCGMMLTQHQNGLKRSFPANDTKIENTGSIFSILMQSDTNLEHLRYTYFDCQLLSQRARSVGRGLFGARSGGCSYAPICERCCGGTTISHVTTDSSAFWRGLQSRVSTHSLYKYKECALTSLAYIPGLQLASSAK